jgi:hypothetical protein
MHGDFKPIGTSHNQQRSKVLWRPHATLPHTHVE